MVFLFIFILQNLLALAPSMKINAFKRSDFAEVKNLFCHTKHYSLLLEYHEAIISKDLKKFVQVSGKLSSLPISGEGVLNRGEGWSVELKFRGDHFMAFLVSDKNKFRQYIVKMANCLYLDRGDRKSFSDLVLKGLLKKASKRYSARLPLFRRLQESNCKMSDDFEYIKWRKLAKKSEEEILDKIWPNLFFYRDYYLNQRSKKVIKIASRLKRLEDVPMEGLAQYRVFSDEVLGRYIVMEYIPYRGDRVLMEFFQKWEASIRDRDRLLMDYLDLSSDIVKIFMQLSSCGYILFDLHSANFGYREKKDGLRDPVVFDIELEPISYIKNEDNFIPPVFYPLYLFISQFLLGGRQNFSQEYFLIKNKRAFLCDKNPLEVQSEWDFLSDLIQSMWHRIEMLGVKSYVSPGLFAFMQGLVSEALMYKHRREEKRFKEAYMECLESVFCFIESFKIQLGAGLYKESLVDGSEVLGAARKKQFRKKRGESLLFARKSALLTIEKSLCLSLSA